jgi:5-methylcytosine-specific restriction enzyme A
MPTRPPNHRPCWAKSPAAVERDRKRQIDERRRRPGDERSNALYSTAAWRRFRASYLADHPLCAECEREGRVTAATVPEHRIPIRDGGPIWDDANLQPMCKPHADAKTARESQAKRRAGKG